MDALRAIQDLAFSTWLRESAWALFACLIVHMWGLAFLVGAGGLIAGRALGLARGASAAAFTRLVPVMWAGFGLALVSGVLLLMAYPAKAMTNPVFAVKFAFLAAGALATARILPALRTAEGPLPGGTKALAGAAIVLWIGLIVCGNLLKYTHRDLLVY